MDGACGTRVEDEKYQSIIGKSEGKSQICKPMRKWKIISELTQRQIVKLAGNICEFKPGPQT
jgi:hypothetical protein